MSSPIFQFGSAEGLVAACTADNIFILTEQIMKTDFAANVSHQTFLLDSNIPSSPSCMSCIKLHGAAWDFKCPSLLVMVEEEKNFFHL